MKSFVSIVLSAVVTAFFFEGVLVLWCFVDIPQGSQPVATTAVVEPPPEIDPLPEAVSVPSPEKEKQPEVAKSPPEIVGPPKPEPRLPFVLNIGRHDGGLMLQGSIPSKKIKDAIYQAATTAAGEDEVSNRLKYSPKTESPDWLPYLPDLVEAFFMHTGGEHDLTIVDSRLILGGSVREEKSEKGILAMTDRFSGNGLKVEAELPVDSKLMDDLPEFSDQTPEAYFEEEAPVGEEESEPGAVVASVDHTSDEKKSFYGPAVGPPEKEDLAVYVSSLKEDTKVTATPEKAEEDVVEQVIPKEPVADDGKPLIFYFNTGSAEILPDDREKVQRAIQRASVPRSIVYITAYADYRGSYQLNKKLSLARAEKVRDAIFAGEIADEVTAEIKAKADSQSESRARRRDDDESLQRSRRVVVEVYHLKS